MARKARQRISYVLPLANSPGGHRLGVNGLAFDSHQSILYSAGRDGVICAWDVNPSRETDASTEHDPFASPRDPPADSKSQSTSSSAFRSQVQAHTHWVNDIILTQSNSALVSASSDLSVKVWRPHSQDGQLPQTIGLHSDYVKCLATPGSHSDWVASGGLDHKIRVWDLNGGGERLSIDAGEDESSAKGSVYALSVRGSIMASGGPESIVRLWDPRSGKRITKFVGHTDNVRDILITQDGDTIMTASSDQTVKVWSMTAGRCMYTLTMHNDSVWSLYSDHQQLSVFYSSDRSGLVAKTDVRQCADMDDGLCVAVAQEQEGVNKVVVGQGYMWTATSRSSIHRWNDIDTEAGIQAVETPRQPRGSSTVSHSKAAKPPPSALSSVNFDSIKRQIPLDCVLQLSNTAIFPRIRDTETAIVYLGASIKKPSEAVIDADSRVVVPYQDLPAETIEGQNGLIKHLMLNDRRRVLTLDTAGEVILWDLLNCVQVQSFGKRHLEDVAPEVNTIESVANWCAVDTRTGRLACVLEENYCFDAEMYADEVVMDNPTDFREDQRINLGKWVLRYLFGHLVDEEIKRDEAYRSGLRNHKQQPNGLQRRNAPQAIQLPNSQLPSWQTKGTDDDSVITPRANGVHYAMMTPGLSIGVATPALVTASHSSLMQNHLPTTAEEGSELDKRTSYNGLPASTTDRSHDYFSAPVNPQSAPESNGRLPTTPGEPRSETAPRSSIDAGEKFKETTSLFSKKFRMNFPKKLGRSSTEAKPATVDEVAEESDKSSVKEDRTVENNFYGIVQKIRYSYDERLETDAAESLTTGITPSLPNETPVLKLPPFTTIIIQEDRPDSGGVADLYEGNVSSVGRDADLIEKCAPTWLGDLLLRNQIPVKETVKVSFVLQPYQDLLPSIASPESNARLNANRMLRAKKILAYVAERIEPQPEHPDPNALRPEEYLELYCQNQLLSPTITLATLRAHVWKTGGDVMLYYKSNGRRPSLEQRGRRDATADGAESSGYN